MTSNDRIILDQVLRDTKAETAPDLSDADFFEIFCASQVLKDHDLSYDEIESGIVHGGNDGGIDCAYILVNGELVLDDTDLNSYKRDVVIELSILQVKSRAGFSEGAIDRLISTSSDLFDLSKQPENLAQSYNDRLLAFFSLFRSTHNALAARFPKLRVQFSYATKGAEVHPNVRRKAKALEEHVQKFFSSCTADVYFFGAFELLERARQQPRKSYPLTLAENPISSSGAVGFISLVRLRDYYKFIIDDAQKLNRTLFEANVRDYQGNVEVNCGIQESLQDSQGEDFWWLNNGITVIAAKATQSGKTLMIEDPCIVNGLQTSTEIYKHFRLSTADDDERNVLMRVIVPSDPEMQDRIIKATNSQTPIPTASLHATEKIHRDIEEFIKPYGYFYD